MKKVRILGKEYTQSNYKLSDEEQKVYMYIQRDYAVGSRIMSMPYEQFNNDDVITRQNKLQKKFNSYQPSKSNDPDTQWQSNAVRPIIRNKVISIAAHITTNLLYPKIEAQNEKQLPDKDAALVMGDLMEWAGEQSKYEKHILYAIIAMLVNPVAYIKVGYREIYRDVKRPKKGVGYKIETILDDDYSGFYIENVPLDELYIGDIYEHDIQKQPFLIRRQVIDYSEAIRLYEDVYSNFQYVKPGIRIMYSEENDCFYEQYDKNLTERQVEVVTYYNKIEDLEILVCNGVMLSQYNTAMERQDKKYPYSKGIYGLIDEGKFFYGKSKVDEMLNDSEIIDILYKTVIDGGLLEIMPYAIAYGAEEFQSSIVVPGKITGLDRDSKVEMGNIKHNLNAGMTLLEKVERSISETSQDPLQSGQGQSGNQTAYEINRLEQNAMTMLGLFGKMIGFFIRDIGNLVLSDILQYLTIGEIDELTGYEKLKYKSFLVPEKIVGGKKVNRQIKFTLDMPLEDMTEDEYLQESLKIMEEESDNNNDIEIFKVNPSLFRNLKYKVKIDTTFMPIKSDAVKKAMNLEAYDRAIKNPLANQEAVFKNFLLENYVPGESEKYIKKEEEQQQEQQSELLQKQKGQSQLQNQLLGSAEQQAQKELSINKQV